MTTNSGSLWSDLKRRSYLLALIWLVGLFVSTLIVHLPVAALQEATQSQLLRDLSNGLATPGWPARTLSALTLNLRDIVAVMLIISLSGGLGRLLIRTSMPFSGIERPLLQALLGLGAISVVILIAGLFGLFPSTPVGTVITIALILILGPSIWRWWGSLREALTAIFSPTPTAFHAWLRHGILLLLILTLLMTFAPPTKWDALTYHLEAPRFYLDAGRIVSYPENHFFGFPDLVGMLYLWLMIVARVQAAALLHWSFGVLALLLIMGLAHRIQRPAVGWIALTILLVCDSLWGEFGWPYNDLVLMAYVVAALICLLAWAESTSPSVGLLAISGGFIGLAMSTKYTAAACAVGLGILTLWLARRGGLRQMVIAGGMVSITALLVFSPWLVKNALLDGNPVSPFVWGTRAFDRFDQYYYLRPGTGLDPISTVLAPIQGSVFGREGAAPYGSSTGPLIVPLLPLALIGSPRRTDGERAVLQSLAIFVVAAYLVWLVGAATSWYLVETRLLFPIFPALALIGAVGVERLAEVRLPINVQVIARAAIGVALAVATVSGLATYLAANSLPVTLGLTTEQQYLQDSLGTYYAAMERVSSLPDGSKILFLWEPRTYYCRRNCVPDSLIDQWWDTRQIEPDPHRIADRWRAEGVTHVLIFEDGLNFLVKEDPYEPLSDADVAALNQLRSSELLQIWNPFPSYTLYQLRQSP